MIYSKILATGSYLPEKVVKNEELKAYFDTSDEWIQSRTGIKQRHVAADYQSCADLAEQAARAALTEAGIDAEQLDLIIVATTSPDHTFPSVAVKLQHRLGARAVAAFDVQAVCAGFVYALSIADQFIKSGQCRRVLVVGAEVFTNILNWQDRTTAILFGDGAGAVVLEASEQAGIYRTVLHSDGSYQKLLWAARGVGSAKNEYANASPYVEMQGREVFKVAVKQLSGLVTELLSACNMQASEIDFLVPHQANLRIISATAQHLNLPMDKVIVTVDKHANTSAASVPLALDYGIKSGKIQRGQTLLLEAFGGGFTWGGAILRY